MKAFFQYFLATWGVLMCCNVTNAQLFIGIDVGEGWNRTPELSLQYHPKNEDWISIGVAGGYTFPGKVLFVSPKSCFVQYDLEGRYMQLTLLNHLTTKRRNSHPYWGVELNWSSYKEVIQTLSCSEVPLMNDVRNTNAFTGAVVFGYSFNPFEKKSFPPPLQIDLGMSAGSYFWLSTPLITERNYIPGLGTGSLPIKRIYLSPQIRLRIQLFKNRYGYKKPVLKHRK